MASPKEGYNSYSYFLVTTPSPTSSSAAAPAVAHVQLNRPDKLNAFHHPMWIELGDVFDRLSVDPSVRAVVLSGAGERAFTAGLDVQASAAAEDARDKLFDDVARKATVMRRHVAEYQDYVSSVERCEKPVICVLHGFCFGLAIDIAACCDVRVCTRDARLAIKEVDIGIVADVGSLSRLPKIVGDAGWLKEAALTARGFGADEALRVGLVGHVLPDKAEALAKALAIAKLIAEKSPVAVQGTKEVLNHARDHSVAESLRYTQVWNAAALQTVDVKKAILSGLQKRKPTFEKL